MKLKGWTPYELSNQTGISTNAIYDRFTLSDLEKSTVMNLMETFKILKNG